MIKQSELLLAAMSFVDEDLIAEAEHKPRRRFGKAMALGAIAAALALFLLALPQPQPNVVPDDPISDEIDADETTLQINWLNTAASAEADMDLLMEMRYDAKVDAYRWPEWTPSGAPLRGDLPIHLPNQPVTDGLTVPDQFAQAAGVNSSEFYAVLQEKFTISSYYILWVRSSLESETYDLAHDHCLELSTESGGTATLSVSRENWPLRCCLMESDAPLSSTVAGVEMVIHGLKLSDSETFFTRFETDGIWYDIEAENIDTHELQFLLETLLGCRGNKSSAS